MRDIPAYAKEAYYAQRDLYCEWDILRRDNIIYEMIQDIPYSAITSKQPDSSPAEIRLVIDATHYKNRQGDLKTRLTLNVYRYDYEEQV